MRYKLAIQICFSSTIRSRGRDGREFICWNTHVRMPIGKEKIFRDNIPNLLSFVIRGC
jgi:hypothetical protein